MKELIFLDVKGENGIMEASRKPGNTIWLLSMQECLSVTLRYILRVLFKQLQGVGIMQWTEGKVALQMRSQKMPFEISWQYPLSPMEYDDRQFALFHKSEIAQDFVSCVWQK